MRRSTPPWLPHGLLDHRSLRHGADGPKTTALRPPRQCPAARKRSSVATPARIWQTRLFRGRTHPVEGVCLNPSRRRTSTWSVPPEAVLALQGPHLQFSSGSHWSLSDRTSLFRRKIFSWIYYDIPTLTPSSPWRCREPRNPRESAFSGGKSLILRCRTGGMAVRAETLPSERRSPGIRLGGGAAWGGGRSDPGQGRGVQRRGPARPPRESRRGPSCPGAGRSRGRQVSPPSPAAPIRRGTGPVLPAGTRDQPSPPGRVLSRRELGIER